MPTTPLEVTLVEAERATDIAEDAVRVLKAGAVDSNAAVVADPIAGFDEPTTNITGVEKLVKAVAMGASKALVSGSNTIALAPSGSNWIVTILPAGSWNM
jgi:hypothetical protein